MFSCKRAARLLSESLDHKLSVWQRFDLSVHMLLCRFCRYFRRDLHRFDAALRIYSRQINAGAAIAQAALRPEARQRILRVMEKEAS